MIDESLRERDDVKKEQWSRRLHALAERVTPNISVAFPCDGRANRFPDYDPTARIKREPRQADQDACQMYGLRRRSSNVLDSAPAKDVKRFFEENNDEAAIP